MTSDVTGKGPMDEGGLRTAILVLAIAVTAVACALLGLWCYHLFLITTGQTTKEHQKKNALAQSRDDDPTLCAPRGPRLFDPRQRVPVEIKHGRAVPVLPRSVQTNESAIGAASAVAPPPP